MKALKRYLLAWIILSAACQPQSDDKQVYYSSFNNPTISAVSDEPAIIDLCNFLNSDAITIATVVSKPVAVSSCLAGSRKYESHLRIEVQSTTNIVGTLRNEFVLHKGLIGPNIGDKILISTIADQDSELVVSIIKLSEEKGVLSARSNLDVAFDLPSRKDLLIESLSRAYRNPVGYCDPVRFQKFLSIDQLKGDFIRKEACGGGIESDNGEPSTEDAGEH